MHCIIYAAHQRLITPKMHPAKDIIYQRCTIGAAHQNYNAPNMHQTLLSLLKATATTGGFN